jgi:hypothetical protein
MAAFSVAVPRREGVAVPQWRRLVWALALALALSAPGCGESQSPTEPAPAPVAQLGLIEGTVRDADGALAGTLVEVTAAPGGSVTTGATGSFLFTLPPGIARVRWSKTGYYPRELDVIVRAGATATADIVLEKTTVTHTLPPPPYTVRGVVRNGRGETVPGAEVWIYGNSSPIDNRYGTTQTDGAGRYSVTSPQRVPQAVRVLKDGNVPRDVSILSPPDAAGTWAVDAVLVHIDRYTLLPLPPLAVGQAARLEAQTELDDGATSRGLLFQQLSSSNPSVVTIEPTGWARATGAGTTTVTATYYGVTTTLSIRVE